VTDISLGEEFPIFSNCRVIAVDDPTSDGGRLQALMDVDLSDDNLSLAVETSLVVNYPKPRSAVLPVALSVSVVRFSGTLCISLIPGAADESSPLAPSSARQPEDGPGQNLASPARRQTQRSRENQEGDDSTDSAPTRTGIPKTSLAFSFLPDYRLELSVRSLIGSRSRLQDVPKVAQLVEARVQAWFEERVVEPRVQVVALPGLWPRMGRTGVRGQEEPELAAADRTADATAGLSDVGIASQDIPGGPDIGSLRRRRNTGGGAIAPVEAIYAENSRERRLREDPFRMPGALPP
jgi:maintenance of morphology protein 1